MAPNAAPRRAPATDADVRKVETVSAALCLVQFVRADAEPDMATYSATFNAYATRPTRMVPRTSANGYCGPAWYIELLAEAGWMPNIAT